MWRLLLIESFLLYSVIIGLACGEKDSALCGENEEYTECVDDCRTCAYRHNCVHTAECRPGCQCINGYFRNNQGICVPEAFCEKICGPNQHYSECGTACPDTCDNYGKPRPCTRQCVKGCFCNEGFVRNYYGECVLPERCEKKCGKNEQFSKCVIPCNDCEIRGKCNFFVCNEGCDCIKGHYRNWKGVCIPEAKCPNNHYCGPLEEYRKCGSACPPTCENRNYRNLACPTVCREGCFCKQGFIREKEGGKCIPESQCPREYCGPHEEYKKCGSACPPTCENRNDRNLACPTVCREGCFCKEGFIREKEGGKCIPESQCPRELCGRGAHFSDCASLCPPTCKKSDRVCAAVCVYGCVCNDPHHVFDCHGNCIPRNQCHMVH